MLKIEPFSPFIYTGKYSDRISPPYDVISGEYKKELLKKDRYNVVRVILPESYDESRRELERWKKNGIIKKIEEGFFYLEQFFGGKVRRGILASLRISKDIKKYIIPHEKTYKKFKEDRYRLFKRTEMNFSPVFLITRKEIDFENIKKEKLFSYKLKDHSGKIFGIFDTDEKNRLRNILSKRKYFIADGHHRFEVALRLFKEGFSERTFIYLASIKDIVIYPTHFILPKKYLKFFKKKFRFGSFKNFDLRVYTDGKIFDLKAKSKSEVFNFLKNLKTKFSPEEVFYTHDEEDIYKLTGEDKFGVILPEISRSLFLNFIKRYKLFPQKTTYFFPKVPSGLLFFPLKDD